MPIEQVRLLKVERMAGLRKNCEPGPRNRALEKQPWLKTVVVLIADHHQNRRLHGTKLRLEIVERGPAHLHATHGVGGALRIVLRQALGKQAPAPRILFLELDAGRSFRIDRRKILCSPLFEVVRNLRRNALEVILVDFFGAIAGARSDHRQHPLWMTQSSVEARETAHRKADDMGLVDPGRIQHVDDIVGGPRLRVGLDRFRNIRRRIASGRERNALMPAREKIELRLPTPVAAAKLMDENDRRAQSGGLVKQAYPVAGFRETHPTSL